MKSRKEQCETEPWWSLTASVLATATVFQQWMLLLAGSALFILAMLSVGLPGAWLLGPMVAGVVAFMQYLRVIAACCECSYDE